MKSRAPYYIVVCGRLALPVCSTLSHNGAIFGEKVIERKMGFDFPYKFV
jgi:hypothetical protein